MIAILQRDSVPPFVINAQILSEAGTHIVHAPARASAPASPGQRGERESHREHPSIAARRERNTTHELPFVAPSAILERFRREANSGGPMSRTRTEGLRATILGRIQPLAARQLTLALDFGSEDPCDYMNRLLGKQKLKTPEALRAKYELPGPMLCLASGRIKAVPVSEAETDRVLRTAFLLGLCTSVFFDPARPVLWTRASLTRRLHLFDARGFYA
jgi:hypothetical protein